MNKGLIAAGIVGVAALGGVALMNSEESTYVAPIENVREVQTEEAEVKLDTSAFDKPLINDNDPTATRPASTGDKDCSDFSSHAQAQAFFESQGSADPHGLDRDGDGSACDSLR